MASAPDPKKFLSLAKRMLNDSELLLVIGYDEYGYYAVVTKTRERKAGSLYVSPILQILWKENEEVELIPGNLVEFLFWSRHRPPVEASTKEAVVEWIAEKIAAISGDNSSD